MSDASIKRSPDPGKTSREEIEELALKAAEAIKQLVAERHALQTYARTKEGELELLRSHMNLIRDSYRRLASEFVTQLQIIDDVVSNAVERSSKAETAHPTPQKHDASTVDEEPIRRFAR